jgi:hypothetical protein
MAMHVSCERKTLFNILRLKAKQGEKGIEPWQVEDYRQWSASALFKNLAQLDLPLDQQSFMAYADACDDVEALLDLLFAQQLDIEQKIYDQVFLLCFELWRRFNPNVMFMAMICDELDYQMEGYEEDSENDEKIQDILNTLPGLIEESVDEENSSKEVFKIICDNCANDLESFLYEYITDQVEVETYSYATELIEDFEPMVSDARFFLFLRLRMTEGEEAIQGFSALYRSLSQNCHLQLLIDILFYLSENDIGHLFINYFKLSQRQNLDEEDIHDLVEALSSYIKHHSLDPSCKEYIISLGSPFKELV